MPVPVRNRNEDKSKIGKGRKVKINGFTLNKVINKDFDLNKAKPKTSYS